MSYIYDRAICWIRRDLRLHDHPALSEALKKSKSVILIFVFDSFILDKIPSSDMRLTFIIDSLKELEEQLQKRGHSIHIFFGEPTKIIPKFVQEKNAQALFFNRDYEPYAKRRDQDVLNQLVKKGIDVFSYRDHVIFESNEIKNGKGETFKVFTPYKNKWLQALKESKNAKTKLMNHAVSLSNLEKLENKKSILHKDWYKEINKTPCAPTLKAGTKAAKKAFTKFQEIINLYNANRDFPSLKGTSSLSVYIRHGNLSIRDMLNLALAGKSMGHQIWLSELIWREFYQTLLDQYPEIENKAFKPAYDHIKWKGSEKHFQAWVDGQTGYPIIDASMRCLAQTGQLHNRLRMVVASFLCKTLLVDWRLGEAYFAQKLLDFDLAANNGGWQWSSSSGADSQPYFRIFNPINQSQKFDPDAVFIKEYCPELISVPNNKVHSLWEIKKEELTSYNISLGKNYPSPIVDYKISRQQALEMYKSAVNSPELPPFRVAVNRKA